MRKRYLSQDDCTDNLHTAMADDIKAAVIGDVRPDVQWGDMEFNRARQAIKT